MACESMGMKTTTDPRRRVRKKPKLRFSVANDFRHSGSRYPLLLCGCLLCRHKILYHGFAHQVGWQEPLRQDEVVELLLIEPRSQRLLGILAQSDQLGESVEIAVRLSGRAIGEALDLLLRKSMGE